MAENKKSFVLYCDLIHTIEQLTDEQSGNLFKHILRYVNDQNPEMDNVITRIAFEPIKQQLKRDLQKYEQIRERNSENARKRWNATASDRIPNDAKNADNDNDNVTDNVTDSDNDNDIKVNLVRKDQEKKGDRVSELFEAIWAAYGKKGNKQTALAKFRRLKTEEMKSIMGHIEAYVKNHKDAGKLEFLPHFTTYLNQRRWDDELPYQQKTVENIDWNKPKRGWFD